jgi:hypothetical protein
MSRAIPPQWDKYGYTFWIPTQVEPTVAIIGSALPALRNQLVAPLQKLSSAISSFSGGKSKYNSGAEREERDRPSEQSKYIKMPGGSGPLSHNNVELTSVRSIPELGK